jgi:hypothetical protein
MYSVEQGVFIYTTSAKYSPRKKVTKGIVKNNRGNCKKTTKNSGWG